MYHEVLCTYLIKFLMGILYLSQQAFQGIIHVHFHSWPYFCLSISSSWWWKISSLLSKVFQQRYLPLPLPNPLHSIWCEEMAEKGDGHARDSMVPLVISPLLHKHINFMLGGWAIIVLLSKKLYYKELYLKIYRTKS